MRTFKFVGLTIVTAAIGLLVGCSQEVTQKDVNKQREAAHQAVADATKRTDEVRHEARKEITDIDQQRNDKVAQLQSDLKSKPDVDAPKLEAQIEQTNRDADKKIAEIREKTGEKQEAAVQKANEKTGKAEHTAAVYEAQKDQQVYVEARQRDLEKYDLSIAELKKRRDNLAGDAKTRFDQRVKMLDDKRSAAGKALDNLNSAKAEDWTTFRDEVSKALNDLKVAYDEAAQQQGA